MIVSGPNKERSEQGLTEVGRKSAPFADNAQSAAPAKPKATAAEVFVFEHGEVRGEFVAEIGVEAARGDEAAEAGGDGTEAGD
jgi:hypothetical protein